MMTRLRKTFAPSGGGFTPVAFFLDMRAAERTARGLERTTAQDVSTGTLLWAGCESPTQRSLRWVFFARALEIPRHGGDIRDTSRHCRCVSLVPEHAISIAIEHE